MNDAHRLLKVSRRSSLDVGAPITRRSGRSAHSSNPMSTSSRSSRLLNI